MNIAILIPELEGGGAERVASLLGNYYVEKGHNVYYFLARGKTKCVYQIKGKRINTEITLNNTQPLSLLKSALIMRRYKKIYKIDVSISFMEEFNYINILSRRKDRVITRICTIISQREDLQKSYFYDKRIVRALYNKADKVVVMTNYAEREMAVKYGIAKKRLIKIPNPITQLETQKGDYKWPYGDDTVICVGRLEDVKQHNVAIRAFSITVKEVPTAKLIILGIGPAESKLKSAVKKLGLEGKVIFLGFKKDIGNYLQHSKVFLMTSKTEGFPNSMLEAMSLRLPVVSIDSKGAPKEILKVGNDKKGIRYGRYGIITPYVNHNCLSQEPIKQEEIELGKAISILLQNKMLWRKYSDASYRRAKMYDTERIMNIWTRIINKEKEIFQ